MILLSYSNSSIKGTEIRGSILYLSLLRPALRHSYSVRHLGLVGSHERNPSVSASGVFDIRALYKPDYYYYNKQAISVNVSKFAETAQCH